jgi:hypothetical protein
MTRTSWLRPLEQQNLGTGHWHIEGYCAHRMGRTWGVKFAGCQAEGTDDPAELAMYRSSLAMARDAIRARIFNEES